MRNYGLGIINLYMELADILVRNNWSRVNNQLGPLLLAVSQSNIVEISPCNTRWGSMIE